MLDRMVKEGFITQSEADHAKSLPLVIHSRKNINSDQTAYFLEQVRMKLQEKYGEDLLYKGGLRIYTTMDAEMQKGAYEGVLTASRRWTSGRGSGALSSTLRKAGGRLLPENRRRDRRRLPASGQHVPGSGDRHEHEHRQPYRKGRRPDRYPEPEKHGLGRQCQSGGYLWQAGRGKRKSLPSER